jgi:hypothetical protein
LQKNLEKKGKFFQKPLAILFESPYNKPYKWGIVVSSVLKSHKNKKGRGNE